MDIDKIIDKVNNLMALASDPAASDNEASLAYERAQRLIAIAAPEFREGLQAQARQLLA